MPKIHAAQLVLKDGTIFHGFSFGSTQSVAGEVVFSTGMVGYPESMTDPSYKGQILCLTFPLIGNYGVPAYKKDEHGLPIDFESKNIHISGLVVSDYSFDYSHYKARRSLSQWLEEHNVPGIFGVDTRALTKKLRSKGSMLGKIVVKEQVDWYDPNKEDLVSQVTITKPTEFGDVDAAKTVVAVDCGIKANIIRCLVKRGVKVIVVPYDYDYSELEYDGLFISNGPGDPKMCKTTIAHLKQSLKEDKPIFGICLGNQLLALAAGANTYKLKFGHRSQNQPAILQGSTRCYITTQNHGFAVDGKTLPAGWEEHFVNANDNTNEGIRHKKKPFFSAQFHPEARAGPVDTEFLFDEFVKLL